MTYLIFCLSLLGSADDSVDLFSTYKRDVVKDSSGAIVPPSRINGFPEYFFQWLETPRELDGKNQILKIATFQYNNLITAELFVVEESGVAYARQMSFLSTRGDGTSHPLRPEFLEKLDSLLAKVPQPVIAPPIDQLICISFRDPADHSKWIVRTFDLRTLPTAVDQVLQVSRYYSLTEHGWRLAKRTSPKNGS
jgi:hypothetical protein